LTRTESATTGFRSVLAASDRRRVVWVNSTAYARRLFAPGEDVWMDTGRHVELVRQAQRLLGSEVIEVRLGSFHRAALEADPSRADPHRGRRMTTALRRLLEDSGPAGIAIEVTNALGVLYPGTPVVLVLDGASRWLRWAASVTGNTDDIDIDGVDAAAVYVADAIRPFGASPVSGVALDLRGVGPGLADELLDPHAPVLNLAGDYGWPVAVILDDAAAVMAVAAKPIDAVLCPGLGFESLVSLHPAARLGGGLNPRFWSGSTTVTAPEHLLAYGAIPADAQPEVVLTKLTEIRTD
jgi:hypothetical protein